MTKYNPKRIGMGKGKGKGYRNLLPTDSRIHYLSAKGIRIKQPVFKSLDLTHLPLELTLYVPSTEKNEQGKDVVIRDEEFLERIDEAENKMSDLFGGYTRVKADGGWYNKDTKDYVKEPVATITAFTDAKDFNENKRKFQSYIQKIRKEYEQDEISIEFEGDLFFYKPKKKDVTITPKTLKEIVPLDEPLKEKKAKIWKEEIERGYRGAKLDSKVRTRLKKLKPAIWKTKFQEKDEFMWEHNGEFVSVVGVKQVVGKRYIFQVFDTNKNKRIIDETFSNRFKAMRTAYNYMAKHPKGLE